MKTSLLMTFISTLAIAKKEKEESSKERIKRIIPRRRGDVSK